MKHASIPMVMGALMLLVSLAHATSAVATTAAANTGPEIQVEDVYRFYKLYDTTGGHPTADQLQHEPPLILQLGCTRQHRADLVDQQQGERYERHAQKVDGHLPEHIALQNSQRDLILQSASATLAPDYRRRAQAGVSGRYRCIAGFTPRRALRYTNISRANKE